MQNYSCQNCQENVFCRQSSLLNVYASRLACQRKGCIWIWLGKKKQVRTFLFYVLPAHLQHLVKQPLSWEAAAVYLSSQNKTLSLHTFLFYGAMNQLATYIKHISLSTSILPLPVLLLLFIFLLLVLHIITAIDKYISLSLFIFPPLSLVQTGTCAHVPDKNKPFV